jgi:hypothetical protein
VKRVERKVEEEGLDEVGEELQRLPLLLIYAVSQQEARA